MISREDFIFAIGFDGAQAVVDGRAKREFGSLSHPGIDRSRPVPRGLRFRAVVRQGRGHQGISGAFQPPCRDDLFLRRRVAAAFRRTEGRGGQGPGVVAVGRHPSIVSAITHFRYRDSGYPETTGWSGAWGRSSR